VEMNETGRRACSSHTVDVRSVARLLHVMMFLPATCLYLRGVKMTSLPVPKCKFGYPHEQLKEALGEEKFKQFLSWMLGQTFSSCEGRIFNRKANRMEDSGCGPHGYVYYGWDVEAFLDGRPALD
jgi:hypothetical protein